MEWLLAGGVLAFLTWSAIVSRKRSHTTPDHLAHVENRMVSLFREFPDATPEQVARLVFDELENRRERDIRYYTACNPATAHRVWRTMRLAEHRLAK